MKAADRLSGQLSLPMRIELRWLATGLVSGAVTGTLLGSLLAGALLGTLIYTVWLLYRLHAVLSWQAGGALPATAPPSTGLTERSVALVHRNRKQARKQKNRYKRSLDQFNALAAQMPDATVVFDEHRQIRWANAAARRLLTINPERDKGQRIDNLLRDPQFKAFLNGPESGTDLELPAPAAPDRTIALRLTSAGNRFALLVARDVTQRVRVREMRKAFVADVSHELRTPLTVIGGYLEVLGDDRTLPMPVQSAIRQIGDQSDRMRALVEHLLELSQLEGNPLADDEGEPVAFASLIRHLVDDLERARPKGDARAHRFELALDDELMLLGAEPELYSVVQNLIGNARRYTAAGTRVHVRWARDDTPGHRGDAVFEVSDEGAGIEARHLPRLSERFYRVDRGRARASGGTGLGLAIVKHVAQRHGGTLSIESTPGQGSTFRIRFPVQRALVAPFVANG